MKTIRVSQAGRNKHWTKFLLSLFLRMPPLFPVCGGLQLLSCYVLKLLSLQINFVKVKIYWINNHFNFYFTNTLFPFQDLLRVIGHCSRVVKPNQKQLTVKACSLLTYILSDSEVNVKPNFPVYIVSLCFTFVTLHWIFWCLIISYSVTVFFYIIGRPQWRIACLYHCISSRVH